MASYLPDSFVNKIPPVCGITELNGRILMCLSPDTCLYNMNNIAFFSQLKISCVSRARQNTPLIPVLERHRQMNLCEFETSLVYIVNSRTVRAAQRDLVSKKKKEKKRKKLVMQLKTVPFFLIIFESLGLTYNYNYFFSLLLPRRCVLLSLFPVSLMKKIKVRSTADK